MIQANEQAIREVVREVLSQLGKSAPGNGRGSNGHARGGDWGVFETVDEAGRTISYTIPEGLPMPVKDYRATMRVADAGAGKSALDWSCTFAPDGVGEAEAQALLAPA